MACFTSSGEKASFKLRHLWNGIHVVPALVPMLEGSRFPVQSWKVGMQPNTPGERGMPIDSPELIVSAYWSMIANSTDLIHRVLGLNRGILAIRPLKFISRSRIVR